MSFQVTLLTGVHDHLVASGVTETIHYDVLPATPDVALALSLYPVEDTLGTDVTVGLQVWARGAPNDRQSVKDLTDKVVDALHGVTGTVFGGHPIVTVLRQSGANLGTDPDGRQETSTNFYIQLTRTGPHRAD